MGLEWLSLYSKYDKFYFCLKLVLGSSAVILASQFFTMLRPVVPFLEIILAIFTILLAFLLWTIDRKGWLLFLIIPAGLLFLLSKMHVENIITAHILRTAPVLFLLFYSWLLQIASRLWQEDNQFARGINKFEDPSY